MSAAEALESAIAAFRAGRANEAERLAAGVLTADRGNVLAAHIVGTARLALGQPQDAVEPLLLAARGSDDPANETLLARALALVGRKEEALEALRRAAARRPPYALAFLELGEQLAALGRLEEAVRALEDGLALAPDADGLRIGLGYVRLQQRDLRMARSLFEQVRAASPERQDAIVGVAKVLVQEGAYADAAELFHRALALRPDDAATRFELGKCLLESGDRAAGEAALREATRAAPRLVCQAIVALASAPHGRVFLRPSAATRFMGA